MQVSTTTNFGLKHWPERVQVRTGFTFTGGEAGSMSKGSIPVGTWPGKDVTCHLARGGCSWAGNKPSESSGGERNRRCLMRKHALVFVLRAVLGLRTPKPSPGCGPAARTCGERPGSPGGTASRENKALRSQKPALTSGRTLGLCPQTPRLSPQPWPGGAERGREGTQGREGGGWKGSGGRRRGGRHCCGQRGRLHKGARSGGAQRCGAEPWAGGARCAWRWPGGLCWPCCCAGSGPTGTSLCSGPRGGGRSQVMPAAPHPNRGGAGGGSGALRRGGGGERWLSRGYPSIYPKSLI